MRPDDGSESFRPGSVQHIHDRESDVVLRASGVYCNDAAGFRMIPLPLGIDEPIERLRDAMVEVVVRRFDPIA